MTISWRGTFTALVTPFRGDGSVDLGALERLVTRQIEGGVEGIVPCGTTGESATLTNDEKLQVIEASKKFSKDRLIIAGAGGNATDAVVRFAREAVKAGADALISVVPYYNRPNQEGLYRHFTTIADEVDTHLFVYDVPSRTGASLLPATVTRLAAHPNVRGIKEASGNLSKVSQILEGRPDGFRVLSGDDHLGVIQRLPDKMIGSLIVAVVLFQDLLQGFVIIKWLHQKNNPKKPRMKLVRRSETYLPIVKHDWRVETRQERPPHLRQISNVLHHGMRHVSVCSSIGASILLPPVSGRART